MLSKAHRKGWLLLFAAGVIIASIATTMWLILWFGERHPMRDRNTAGAVTEKSEIGAFVRHDAPRTLPEITFQDDTGMELSLADFSGQYLLLNLWATWCVPCREEMPTLDGLQATLGGDQFEVVALSVDRAGMAVVRKFYREIGIRHLGLYIDTSMKSSFALAVGLPTTLLIDKQGKEIGRLVGPAHWDSPEMIRTIEAFVRN